MSAIDLIVFDCDGVLIDSEVLSADVMIDELDKIGVTIDRPYVRKHFLGRSFPTVAKTLRSGVAPHLPADFETRYRAALLKRFETELRPTPGLPDVLEHLNLPICVATSSSPTRASRSLEISGLAKHFDGNVFTASQVENGKPAPDLVLFACRQMGVSPRRALVIEDSAPGLVAARSADAVALAYCGGSHMMGSQPDVPFFVPSFDNWADFPHLFEKLQGGSAL
ncbi:HAD family hydrolase [Pseudoprimorskyibacter insulae]|uniref:6-phosphogluconate phosphatase n=1 Tax=Pseudoprimorskyibacter insulae TaxID=1695997 RepID=A0A2R8APN0_9RHOB|nr:HAD-IA family hydrolase [Pseudoprimorskyibacter insulae]SPF78001.1 6-phosphogluconate phosphatase [Pseudoprimorskyibacter insulae]